MRSRLFLLIVLTGFPALPHLAAQTESGLAGISSDSYAGKTTASGEKYDPDTLTAAAADIRLGMRLAVTNPLNNRTVTVRVNDNRPLAGGRILEVSRAAAKALGLLRDELTRVEIHALRVDEPDITKLPPAPLPPPAETPSHTASLPPPPETYFQMGAFRTEPNAQLLARSLTRQGEQPQIFKNDSLFRVYLIVKEAEAPALIEKLTKGKVGFFQVSKEPAGTSVKLSTE